MKNKKDNLPNDNNEQENENTTQEIQEDMEDLQDIDIMFYDGDEPPGIENAEEVVAFSSIEDLFEHLITFSRFRLDEIEQNKTIGEFLSFFVHSDNETEETTLQIDFMKMLYLSAYLVTLNIKKIPKGKRIKNVFVTRLSRELIKPKYNNVLIKDLLEGAEDNKLVNEALETVLIPSFGVKQPLPSIEYPIDIVNNNIWDKNSNVKILLNDNEENVINNPLITSEDEEDEDTIPLLENEEIKDDPKQKELVFNNIMQFSAGKKKDKEAFILAALNYNELENMEELAGVKISKELTLFDKCVCVAFYNLCNNYDYFTLDQIYREMGHGGKKAADTDKINILNSLYKMNGTYIRISNTNEAELFKNKAEIRYMGHLLEFECIEALVNGKIVKSVILPLSKPQVIELLAKQRGQITTITREAYMLPEKLNATEPNLLLRNYLVTHIAFTNKKTNKNKKLYLKTIYEACHIGEGQTEKTAKQTRYRTKKNIIKFLDQFVTGNLIKKYEILKDEKGEYIKFN